MDYFRNFAENPHNTLVFVGYQADGTIGRRIQKGWKEIPMTGRNGNTEILKMNMEVQVVDGFSGHSDRAQLMDYIKRMQPRPERVFTEHGDEKACVDLASSIYKKLKIEALPISFLKKRSTSFHVLKAD